MTKVDALLQLGVRGKDLVLSTFKKINKEKKEFSKPSKANVSAKEETAKEESKLGSAAKGAGAAIMDLAKSASTLDPSAVLHSVTSSLGKAISAIPIPLISGVGEAIAEAGSLAINAATGSVSAVKSALGTALETYEKQSRIKSLGGSNLNNSNLTLGQQSAVVEGAANRFGKISKEYGNTIKGLIDANVDLQQTMALTQGNFMSLGSDKGFFYQQIANQFSGLPPTIAQTLNNQLIKSINRKELTFSKEAADVMASMKAFDKSERETSKTIASMSGTVTQLNSILNNFRVTLVGASTTLNSTVNSFAKTVDGALRFLPKAYSGTQSAVSGINRLFYGDGKKATQ